MLTTQWQILVPGSSAWRRAGPMGSRRLKVGRVHHDMVEAPAPAMSSDRFRDFRGRQRSDPAECHVPSRLRRARRCQSIGIPLDTCDLHMRQERGQARQRAIARPGPTVLAPEPCRCGLRRESPTARKHRIRARAVPFACGCTITDTRPPRKAFAGERHHQPSKSTMPLSRQHMRSPGNDRASAHHQSARQNTDRSFEHAHMDVHLETPSISSPSRSAVAISDDRWDRWCAKALS